jgi:hypothetical protein
MHLPNKYMIYFLLVIPLVWIYFGIRIHEFQTYAERLIDAVLEHEDWQKKSILFMEVEPRLEMLWKFWRSPESFYPKELSDLLKENTKNL